MDMFVDTLWQDLRFAVRSLRKSLLVTLFAVLSLGLAIAGNTTVFSLVNGLLYRPLPYPDADRLVLLTEHREGTPKGIMTPASPANYLDWRERQTSFESIAGFTNWPMNLGLGAQARSIAVGQVSPDFFTLLGGEASHGRLFSEEEAVRGNQRVVVLGDHFWQSHHGGETSILGQSLRLDGESYTVIGILPPSFEFLDPSVQIWAPLVLPDDPSRSQRTLLPVARLARGVSEEQAQAAMTAIGEQLAQEHPTDNRGFDIELLNLRKDVPDHRNRILFALLQWSMIFVLLIACANAANLLLARSQQREREIAVRASLGAGRTRIVRQLFTESLLMASAAGVMGITLGTLGIRVVRNAFGAFLPAFWEPVLDFRVLAYTVVVTLIGGLLFGLAPVRQTARLDFVTALKEGSRGAGIGSNKRLLSRSLVVVEIALALILMGGAVVMTRTFLEFWKSDPGFETDRLATLTVKLPDSRYTSADAKALGVTRLVEKIESIPGIRHATATNAIPRSPFTIRQSFSLDDHPLEDDELAPLAAWITAPPSYLDTLGVKLLQGRWIEPSDSSSSERVVIVNRALAERYWPEESALDRTLTTGGHSRRVVGVVETIQHEFIDLGSGHATLYVPYAQAPHSSMSLLLRTDVEPEKVYETLRREIAAHDEDMAIAGLQTLDEFIAQFNVGAQIFGGLLSAFGALALFLAALGTYGVLAYSVAQRVHEIGVRMALGASQRQVTRMVTQQGMKLAVLGVLLGIPGVIAVRYAVAAAMADFVEVPTSALSGVVAVLLLTTLVASLLPARRAARIEPIEALRQE